MNWLYYLLEANFYLFLFYGFYKFVLQQETFNNLNRFYLLFTSVLAFILPFFQLSGLTHTSTAPIVMQRYNVTSAPIHLTTQPVSEFWTVSFIFIMLYLVIALIFLIKFILRLYQVIRLIKKYGVQNENGIKKVEMRNERVSFSFLNYLFIDPLLPGMDTIKRHENIHIRHYHTLDVLLFELLQIINWFNPLIAFVKKEIKAVHEFIADEETLNDEIDAESYSMFLIHHSYGPIQDKLSSQMFNGYLLKKRIVRLYQKRSLRTAKWKYVLIFPLLVLMVCLSSVAYTKTYGIDLLPQEQQFIIPANFNFNIAKKAYPIKSPSEIVHSFSKHKIRKIIESKDYIVDQTESKIASQPEQYPVFNIDARTDTIKIRTLPDKMAKLTRDGMYVIGDKIFSERELNNALKPTGKMDIILPNKPSGITVYSENDANAMKKWGKRAEQGVVVILPRKDTVANSAYK